MDLGRVIFQQLLFGVAMHYGAKVTDWELIGFNLLWLDLFQNSDWTIHTRQTLNCSLFFAYGLNILLSFEQGSCKNLFEMLTETHNLTYLVLYH